MIYSLKCGEGDAPNFIEMVNKIMRNLIFDYWIKEVCHIKIKNWFDHKWLNYSGYAIIRPNEGGGLLEGHMIKESQWREKITVPPFNPNRVIYEKYFRRLETNNKMFEKVLHKKKMSNNNIHNRISSYTENGMFIWYSSNTKLNEIGSLMAYRIQQSDIETWYATLEKQKENWIISKTKGIGINELNAYLK